MKNNLYSFLFLPGVCALVLLLGPRAVMALPPPPAGASTAATAEKPVSLSYLNVVKCFPELKNEQWSLKVDLNQLKDQADRQFATAKSLLRYRQALLKDASGHQKRLRLAAKPMKRGRVTYALTLDKLDAKGEGTPVDVPVGQRTNPTQKDLDQFFLNQEVIDDETSYFDTKLNGVTMSYKKNLKEVFELEISDPRARRRLFCEDQKSLGKVCSCTR